MEEQLDDSEADSFVDIDSESSEKDEKPSRPINQKRLEEQKRERALLEKMKLASNTVQETVSLQNEEAYCEACHIKLDGDMNISVSHSPDLFPVDSY